MIMYIHTTVGDSATYFGLVNILKQLFYNLYVMLLTVISTSLQIAVGGSDLGLHLHHLVFTIKSNLLHQVRSELSGHLNGSVMDFDIWK